MPIQWTAHTPQAMQQHGASRKPHRDTAEGAAPVDGGEGEEVVARPRRDAAELRGDVALDRGVVEFWLVRVDDGVVARELGVVEPRLVDLGLAGRGEAKISFRVRRPMTRVHAASAVSTSSTQ